MVVLDPDGLDTEQKTRLIQCAVSPRPIAWISTISSAGVENLAPFSSYTYVSSKKPAVMFTSPNGPPDELKDTARNALTTEEFAVNIVTGDLVEKMVETASTVNSEISEFDYAGVERANCVSISPSRVANSHISLECVLYNFHKIFDRVMIIGEVKCIYVDDNVITDSKLDAREVDTIGALGGGYYTTSDPIERQY